MHRYLLLFGLEWYYMSKIFNENPYKGKSKIKGTCEDIHDYFTSLQKKGASEVVCNAMKYDIEQGEDSFNLEAFEADIKALEKTSQSLNPTVPPEFGHVLKVLQAGIAKGYEPNGWLNDRNSPRMSHKENHDSMFHHLAESFNGTTKDGDSGLHPLLHLATRALMGYTRYMRNIRSDRE